MGYSHVGSNQPGRHLGVLVCTKRGPELLRGADSCQVLVELFSMPMPMAGKDGMGLCAPQSSADNQAVLKASMQRDLSPAKAHSANTHCCRWDHQMLQC